MNSQNQNVNSNDSNDSNDNQNTREFTPNQLLYLQAMKNVELDEVQFIKRQLLGNKLTDYFAGLPSKGCLNSLQREVLIGAMLGDGTLRKEKNAVNVNFKYDLTIATKEVVVLVYSIFQDLVGTPPATAKKAKSQDTFWFRTYRLKELRHWQKLFYTIDAHGDNVRRVPNQLHKWITPLSLAIWFMDDGSKDIKAGYYLHTQCFTQGEVKKLQQILGNKFHLEVSIQKDDKQKKNKKFFRLYILQSSVPKFNALVEPFILPCMRYKLHENKTQD